MADAMTHIATGTLSGASSDYYFQFTSIPQTYKHLRVIVGTGSRHVGNSNAGSNGAMAISGYGGSTSQTVSMALTSGSANFSNMGPTSSATSDSTKIGTVSGSGFWDGTEGGYAGCGIVDIYNYADTTYMKPRSYIVSNANGVSTNFGLEMGASLLPKTGAITQFEFGSNTGTGNNGYGSTSYPMHVYLFGIGVKA